MLGALVGVRLLTELLNPAAYGELALAMTIATLVNQTATGPLSNGIARFYAPASERGDLKGYLRAVRKLVSALTSALALFILVAAAVLLVMGRARWIPITAAALGFAAVSGCNSILNGIQGAARHRSVVALHQAMETWGRFLLAAAFLTWVAANAPVAMVGQIVGSGLVLVSQYLFFKRVVPAHTASLTPAAGWTQQIWKYSWPFASWSIFTWAQMASDRWALGLFAGTREVGFYAVLYQLGYYPISLFTAMVVQLLAPIFYQRAGDATDKGRNAMVKTLSWRLTGLTLGLTLCAFILVSFFHAQIFRIFVASEYAPMSHLLPWILLSGGLFAAGQTIALSLMSQMKTQIMVTAKIVTAILGVSLNFAGAYWFGIVGVVMAGVGFSIAHLLWMVALAKELQTIDPQPNAQRTVNGEAERQASALWNG